MNALVVGRSLFNACSIGSISSRGCTPRVLRSVAGMWLRTASAFLGRFHQRRIERYWSTAPKYNRTREIAGLAFLRPGLVFGTHRVEFLPPIVLTVTSLLTRNRTP